MTDKKAVSPAKRKRLLNTYGPCPAGYTQQDIERLLDVLYGMFSHVYTSTELQQMMICNPFCMAYSHRQSVGVATSWTNSTREALAEPEGQGVDSG